MDGCADSALARVHAEPMVIAGLAIALGEVVDDAIIDVENVYRRLRLNRSLAEPLPAWRVVIEASMEVRSAVVRHRDRDSGFPAGLLSGRISRQFLPPTGAFLCARRAASLAVALTVTPAMALILLRVRRLAISSQETAFARFLKRAYRAVLAPLLGRPLVIVAGLVVTFILTGLASLNWVKNSCRISRNMIS
jgi:Cu/Ag efflux pump CusA